jgi:trigger factor
MAEKKDVERPAKKDDEAWIDFKGVDEKGEPINGADGKDYPLVLGSNKFIPGFEDNVVGMKPGEEKTFPLNFPKDYGVKALAGKKVKFTVKVNKLQELSEPKLDDAFAAMVGPF